MAVDLIMLPACLLFWPPLSPDQLVVQAARLKPVVAKSAFSISPQHGCAH